MKVEKGSLRLILIQQAQGMMKISERGFQEKSNKKTTQTKRKKINASGKKVVD